MTSVHLLHDRSGIAPPHELLATALEPFAAELRLIDPADLICLGTLEKHRTINDLVDSAAELFFRSETLRYAGAAEIDVAWERPPVITLDMEFQNGDVVALFRLTLGVTPPAVTICHLLLGGGAASGAASSALADSLARARLGGPVQSAADRS